MARPDAIASPRDGFRFEYDPGVVRFGSGSAAELVDELDRQGIERALVVCGSTVGSTPDVIDPVTEGLGDRLAGVFAETTPEKRLATAYDGLDAVSEHDADALVALGGGSSLDVATLISALSADDRDPEAVGRELADTSSITVPDGDLLPVVGVPTTLAGADLSAVAGVTASPDSGLVEPDDVPAGTDAVGGGVSDPRLMPAATVYDPELFATTPERVLAASAMNGFDKGVETLYASNATPVTDATAARGLGLLADGLRRLGDEGPTAEVLEPVVEGILLVQYGISRPGETTLSVIHAFGHGLTRTSDVQQGAAHAVIAPHALRYLFERVDARRDLLADALGAPDAADPAEAVVDAVTEVRDALGLPARLRDVDGPEPEAFPQVAEEIVADSFIANAPPGLAVRAEEIEAVLREAY
ncbi:Alcohol dehydrogenase, class IV [Natronoarchaeum philippinense]|uniref:Alcohol dehydrogenase, class IV n=1 Tax=Natronoarchaeum philippinense TaxID=558529 RepID=A0A285P4N2_NATPI|nr:iron-containing alcohol dehydrogenase family protein [Natronoarchaeum philippinense]SNZ16227.1 Alcohol dehydrogenase, class IV [Natronoarchaeum philippinense]